jgi:hypothetical protein
VDRGDEGEICRMNVDEFKHKHGEQSLNGFFDVGTVIHSPAIPINLYAIITDTIHSLNQIYIPFTLGWITQRRPKILERIREIEGEINVAVLCENKEYLKEQLDLYYSEWMEAIVEFDEGGRKYVPF